MSAPEHDQRRWLNEYLACEFGMDESLSNVSHDWPFALVLVRTFAQESHSTQVFEFQHEGVPYFAVDGASLSFYSSAGMSAVDLEVQIRGAEWIGDHDPIDSNSSAIGDERVPPAVERRSRIRALAIAHTGRDDATVLEGLFLRKTSAYLALAQTVDGTAIVVSEQGATEPVPFPEASPWRRLSYGVGRAGGLTRSCEKGASFRNHS